MYLPCDPLQQSWFCSTRWKDGNYGEQEKESKIGEHSYGDPGFVSAVKIQKWKDDQGNYSNSVHQNWNKLGNIKWKFLWVRPGV